MDRTEYLLERWEDQRAIKNMMGKMTLVKMRNDDGDIFDTFWAHQEDVCLGFNDGWYVGAAAVKGYYDAVVERNMLVAKTLQAAFPEKLGDKTDEELYSTGPYRITPMYYPVIEVAGDRKTAKGHWPCFGMHSEIDAAGPVANWTWGYIVADFVREGDEWRIWHLCYLNDVDSIMGQSWGKPEVSYPELPEFAPLKDFSYPPYSVSQTLREYYRPDRPVTEAPPLPEPYETFAETFSYGI